MNLTVYDNLLTLVRNAILDANTPLPSAPDWQELIRMARLHGIEPLMYDAALRLPAEQVPDKALAMQMKQVCVYQMQQQTQWIPRIRKAVEALRAKNIEPVLLKGFGLADLYPKPYLRSWGDADIWVGIKAYHPACGALREAFPEAIHHDEEYEELKHYGIVFPDSNAIELHRIAMDFPTRPEEAYWQMLEVEGMREAIAHGKRCLEGLIPVPGGAFNTLFLFLHMWEHFCGTGMPLKQVLDIALFVRSEYEPLTEDEKRRWDTYLSTHLERFHLSEAWQLVACVTRYVTGIRLPLTDEKEKPDNRQQRLLECVLAEGMCREKEFALGGSDRYDERERVKQLPVWRRKIITLRGRFAHARFLRQYSPEYARHTLWAAIGKGIRRTIRRERMIDY